jgi:hypothetical protein
MVFAGIDWRHVESDHPKLRVQSKPVGAVRGSDVDEDGMARFDRPGMFRLVAGAPRRRHVLKLSATDPGLRAYVFTFGP